MNHLDPIRIEHIMNFNLPTLLSSRCSGWRDKIIYTFISLISLYAMTTGAEPLKVCVSTPDIQSIVEAIGKDSVSVTSFSQGSQDPHQIQIRPSMARALQNADLVIWIGQGLESAWKDRLLTQAGAEQIADGSKGSLDLGQFVEPPEEPEEEDEEEEAGFHEEGNPHYMLDPWEGLESARRITLKLIELRGEEEATLQGAFAEWASEWKSLCFGDSGDTTDWTEFLKLSDESRMDLFKKWNTSARESKTGLFGMMANIRSTPLVGDHDLWGYVERRFNLNVVGYIEAHPGAAPTTRHLTGLVKEMKATNAKIILQSPYFSKRYIQFVQRATQAKAVLLAHQTQALPEASSYLKMLEINFKRLVDSIESTQ